MKKIRRAFILIMLGMLAYLLHLTTWNIHEFTPAGIHRGLTGQAVFWLVQIDEHHGHAFPPARAITNGALHQIWRWSNTEQRAVMERYLEIRRQDRAMRGQSQGLPVANKPALQIRPARNSTLLSPLSASAPNQ